MGLFWEGLIFTCFWYFQNCRRSCVTTKLCSNTHTQPSQFNINVGRSGKEVNNVCKFVDAKKLSIDEMPTCSKNRYLRHDLLYKKFTPTKKCEWSPLPHHNKLKHSKKSKRTWLTFYLLKTYERCWRLELFKRTN